VVGSVGLWQSAQFPASPGVHEGKLHLLLELRMAGETDLALGARLQAELVLGKGERGHGKRRQPKSGRTIL